MLTRSERGEKYKAIETVRRLRATNLRKLAEVLGSWAELGRQTGLASSYLTQMAGPNPTRSVGEVVARDIERALKLTERWLDRAHGSISI
jgi:hypothetical protein